jgi:Spy/CpxP family protein refolding chaperone
MKKKKGFITLAVTVVSSLLLFTACKEHRPKGEFMLDYFSEALDLNAEQQEKLSGIRTELEEQVENMHEDKAEMHETIKTQLANETIDKEVVRQLIADHRAKMDTLTDLAVDRLAAFHAELSAEQKEKLIAKLEKFEKYHSKRSHH